LRECLATAQRRTVLVDKPWILCRCFSTQFRERIRIDLGGGRPEAKHEFDVRFHSLGHLHQKNSRRVCAAALG
jgi:hypothetical protein